VTGNAVDEIGFCLDDTGEYGASPDGLVGESGLLEVKCPAPHTHVGYLLGDKLPTKYVPQVMGQLAVTGLDFCDFASYCPGLDIFIVRVQRDEAYIDALKLALAAFQVEMDKRKGILLKLGYGPLEALDAD